MLCPSPIVLIIEGSLCWYVFFWPLCEGISVFLRCCVVQQCVITPLVLIISVLCAAAALSLLLDAYVYFGLVSYQAHISHLLVM